MRKPKILTVAVAVALSLPAIASAGNAGVVVEFSFKESELATSAAREVLLDRIEEHSKRSCENGSSLATIVAVRRCAEDLTNQFVQAIGDEELSQLAGGEEPEIYESASR